MITASEAKQLYDDSGAEVENYIQYKIENEIRKNATAGKRSMFHVVESVEAYRNVDPTPLQRRIVTRLKELGFHAEWKKDTSHTYVPRGLADDDGKGPNHNNVGIQIGW